VERVCDRVAVLRQGKLAQLVAMSELLQGRLVQARFAGLAPAPPPLAGLHVRSCSGDQMALEHTGSLAELLAWLAEQHVSDLRVEPLGLNAIYYRHHGNAE
jgi:hypothetical protein